jgi:tetratricopeptide (TPR) repeat protein
MAGSTEESRRAFEHLLALDPKYAEALCTLAAVYADLGRHDEAVAHAVRGQGQHGGAYMLEVIAYCYGVSGRRADARAALDALLAASASSYVAPMRVAIAYAGGGAARVSGEGGSRARPAPGLAPRLSSTSPPAPAPAVHRPCPPVRVSRRRVTSRYPPVTSGAPGVGLRLKARRD